MTNFETLYNDVIKKALVEKFGYKNPHEIPKLTKIVLNMGVGDAITDKKKLNNAVEEMAMIAGQKPVITSARKSIATPRHMAEGSSMYLKPGETLTVETLLYGLLLCSGNDAAVALADHCGGSVARFVGWMNETAQRIGMTGSSFANPNGLDDEQHYSTARDMALLAAYAARNPTFVRLCSTRSVTVGGRTMTNHNKLLQSVEGCIGMKTGYTKAAGRTLVSCVRRDGRTLVAVTLQDGNDWADHAEMLSLPEKG